MINCFIYKKMKFKMMNQLKKLKIYNNSLIINYNKYKTYKNKMKDYKIKIFY